MVVVGRKPVEVFGKTAMDVDVCWIGGRPIVEVLAGGGRAAEVGGFGGTTALVLGGGGALVGKCDVTGGFAMMVCVAFSERQAFCGLKTKGTGQDARLSGGVYQRKPSILREVGSGCVQVEFAQTGAWETTMDKREKKNVRKASSSASLSYSLEVPFSVSTSPTLGPRTVP